MRAAEIDLAGRLTTPAGRRYQMAGVTRTGRTRGAGDARWWEATALPVPATLSEVQVEQLEAAGKRRGDG